MVMKKNLRAIISTILICIVALSVFSAYTYADNKDKNFIKWVDLTVPYEVMLTAYKLDVKYAGSDVEFKFTDILAYLATRNGNSFNIATDNKRILELEKKVLDGKKIDDFYKDNKYYNYYKEAYEAIFAEFIGYYIEQDSNEIKYGLKNYHPIASGFWFSHSDDFGVSRNYGFKRRHLGHDLMGSVGTPIIAIEGGIVTDIGWNQYGGWRVGIRSLDNMRSYYYAHLKKNQPYIANLKKGDKIMAGQVIGYLGVTGYSRVENTNMKTKPHLHLGMQLIFDQCQIKGPREIWVDMYQITKFLSHNRARVVRDGVDYKSVGLKV